MNEPCKEGKCIAYPVCINNEYIDCPIHKEYVEKLIVRSLIQRGSNTTKLIPLTEEQSMIIWRHLATIFPKRYSFHNQVSLKIQNKYQSELLIKYLEYIKGLKL